ncbi:MAG: [FeFe] hydrogenase H-cluster radical SAM maturase HydE, partial [Elusimicrobiota bacterium]|nr:[FeFe] hydrogenase H-cluster radical SAM maturase HydE [Elusimicrobiota bacterium]
MNNNDNIFIQPSHENYEKVLTKDKLYRLLTLKDINLEKMERLSTKIKKKYVGNIVYYRGLVEYSNLCQKDCYYCGIRCSNNKIKRYTMTDDEVLEAAIFAYEKNYASIVLQSGERTDKIFIEKITSLIKKIHKVTNPNLKITLSLGEQTEETYKKWLENGAARYLLRIETSSKILYEKLHPNNENHSYINRLKSIEALHKLDYQVGSGVMIGLPFQTIDDLVNDLLFFRDYDIDMIGMGPYIEHKNTPLYSFKNELLSKKDRFYLSLKMIATLRILMKDINIAATTAMQSLDPLGREKAIMFGANVIMPNLTPLKYRKDYLLYENKPCIEENADLCSACLEKRIKFTGNEIGYGKWGNSKHYEKKLRV